MRAVIDTNALLSAERRQLLFFAAINAYELVLSDYIIAERRETMAELRWNPRAAQGLIDDVTRLARMVDHREITGGNYDRWLFDRDDFPIMATALAGGAEYIVTWNTRDFPPKRRFAGVTITTPDAFIRLLTQPRP